MTTLYKFKKEEEKSASCLLFTFKSRKKKLFCWGKKLHGGKFHFKLFSICLYKVWWKGVSGYFYWKITRRMQQFRQPQRLFRPHHKHKRVYPQTWGFVSPHTPFHHAWPHITLNQIYGLSSDICMLSCIRTLISK